MTPVIEGIHKGEVRPLVCSFGYFSNKGKVTPPSPRRVKLPKRAALFRGCSFFHPEY